MSDKSRFQRTLHYESYITNLASQVGTEQATDEAKVMLDGACNALTRLKGPRVSAEFAMQLGDRVVGNFDVTNLDKPAEVKVEEKTVEVKPKRATHVGVVIDLESGAWLFFFGFAIGLMARFL